MKLAITFNVLKNTLPHKKNITARFNTGMERVMSIEKKKPLKKLNRENSVFGFTLILRWFLSGPVSSRTD